MTAKGRQWRLEVLRTADVQTRPDLQNRVVGLDRPHLSRLTAILKAGGKMDNPIKVAKVGQALYVVDGFHRLEAHRRAKKHALQAEVATMSLAEAIEESKRANTRHGKSLNRKDKQARWQAFIDDDHHLRPDGVTKASPAIERELDYIYTARHIRNLLKGAGIELAEGDGFKPWSEEGADEEPEEPEDPALDLAAQAGELVSALASLFPQLTPGTQIELCGIARGLVEAWDRGETPQGVGEALENPLGI